MLLACASCQLFVESEPGSGVGARCNKDTDCQASDCVEGVCARPCESQEDCPEGTVCTTKQLCQLPLRAAFIYPGGEGQDWTLAHEEGRAAAQAALSYLQTKTFADADTPAKAAQFAKQAVDEGFQVVFGASPDFNAAMIAQAQSSPGVQFFTCGGGGGPGNHHGYFGRIYKSWYLAGVAAATHKPMGRFGAIGSYVTPSVVRNINAFARGVQSVSPLAVVEVRWMHGWVDPDPGQTVSIDRQLAAALIDDTAGDMVGCDVVTYHGFNRFAAIEIEETGTAAAADVIGNNYVAACDGNARCIGTVYWNWGPIYARFVDAVHAEALGGGAGAYDDIGLDPVTSVPNFVAHSTTLQPVVAQVLAEMVAEGGIGRPFVGPLCYEDGTTCLMAGEALTDADLGVMCRFVEGVVESVGNMDVPAIVPPEGGCAPAM